MQHDPHAWPTVRPAGYADGLPAANVAGDDKRMATNDKIVYEIDANLSKIRTAQDEKAAKLQALRGR